MQVCIPPSCKRLNKNQTVLFDDSGKIHQEENVRTVTRIKMISKSCWRATVLLLRMTLTIINVPDLSR